MEQLQKYHDKLYELYKLLNDIHENLKKELQPLDFINIGSYTMESKGALLSAIGNLHKVIDKY